MVSIVCSWSALVFVALTKDEINNEFGLSAHGKEVVGRIPFDLTRQVCCMWTLQSFRAKNSSIITANVESDTLFVYAMPPGNKTPA